MVPDVLEISDIGGDKHKEDVACSPSARINVDRDTSTRSLRASALILPVARHVTARTSASATIVLEIDIPSTAK